MSKSPIRTVNIGGKVHRLCVLRVESRDENGLPENLTFVPDDRAVELSTDPEKNHFMLAWINAENFVPPSPPSPPSPPVMPA